MHIFMQTLARFLCNMGSALLSRGQYEILKNINNFSVPSIENVFQCVCYISLEFQVSISYVRRPGSCVMFSPEPKETHSHPCSLMSGCWGVNQVGHCMQPPLSNSPNTPRKSTRRWDHWKMSDDRMTNFIESSLQPCCKLWSYFPNPHRLF